MAQVPTIERSVLLPGPQPVPQGPGAGPAIARGAAEFGQALQREGMREADENDRSALAEQRLKFVPAINALAREMERDDHPETAGARFQERAQDLIAERLDALPSRRAQQAFQREATALLLSKRERVSVAADGRIRGRKRAALDEGLTEITKDIVASDSSVERDTFMKAGLASIDAMRADGVVTPEQAQAEKSRFRQTVAEALARRAIRQDPEGMMAALADPDQFRDLDPIRKERLLQMAESEWRQQLAMEARRDRLAEKERKRREEQTALEGDRLLLQGELTRDWVDENLDDLSTPDQRYFLRAITGGDAQGDPGTYADLLIRASEGENVTQEARRLFGERQLSLEHFEKLQARVEKAQDADFKRGERFLRNFLGISEFTGSAIARQRYADAIEEWRQWLDGHPEADDAAMEKAFRRIGKERSFGLDFAHKDGAALPSLQEVDRMEDDLARRVGNKEISPQEAEKEAERLDKLRREVLRQQGGER